MPTASQLCGDLPDRARPARLTRRPTPRPRSQLLARRRNLGVLLGDGPRLTAARRAPPPALVPHKPHRPTERREVHQLHSPLTVGPQRPATDLTDRSGRPPADVHPQRHPGFVFDAEDLDVAQSHQQLTDARRVALHRDPPDSRLPVSADSGGSLAFSRGPLPPQLRPHSRRATKPPPTRQTPVRRHRRAGTRARTTRTGPPAAPGTRQPAQL